MDKIRIGTRGSKLALYQAELLKSHLKSELPLAEVEIVILKVSADMIRRQKAHPLQNKRIFTKEIEEALLMKEIDVAVHSAKDLSADDPAGLKIGAVLEREDPRDCLIQLQKKKLSELPPHAKIGTGALRRKSQILHHFPELNPEDVFGNIDTRIRKAEDGHYDAVVLAYAGVKRISLTDHVAEVLDPSVMCPAPAQGIIAVQMRSHDSEMENVLKYINHEDSSLMYRAERAFLKKLGGGCQLPCGMWTILNGPRMEGRAVLLSLDGQQQIEASTIGRREEPEELGIILAEKIIASGGKEILEVLAQE